MRLRESRPRSVTGALLVGLGVTGALASLGAMLLLWKPSWPALISACVVSALVAAVGRWITQHCTGPTGRSSPRSPDGAERPVGQWSGPRRQFIYLEVGRRACAATAAQRPYVILPRPYRGSKSSRG